MLTVEWVDSVDSVDWDCVLWLGQQHQQPRVFLSPYQLQSYEDGGQVVLFLYQPHTASSSASATMKLET
ncbi:hypothetical protein ACLKA6_001719 [Drosophila palustris]